MKVFGGSFQCAADAWVAWMRAKRSSAVSLSGFDEEDGEAFDKRDDDDDDGAAPHRR